MDYKASEVNKMPPKALKKREKGAKKGGVSEQDSTVSEIPEDVQTTIDENVDAIEDSLDLIRKASQKKPDESAESRAERKRYRDSRRLVFLLGTLIGVVLAVYFGPATRWT